MSSRLEGVGEVIFRVGIGWFIVSLGLGLAVDDHFDNEIIGIMVTCGLWLLYLGVSGVVLVLLAIIEAWKGQADE